MTGACGHAIARLSKTGVISMYLPSSAKHGGTPGARSGSASFSPDATSCPSTSKPLKQQEFSAAGQAPQISSTPPSSPWRPASAPSSEPPTRRISGRSSPPKTSNPPPSSARSELPPRFRRRRYHRRGAVRPQAHGRGLLGRPSRTRTATWREDYRTEGASLLPENRVAASLVPEEPWPRRQEPDRACRSVAVAQSAVPGSTTHSACNPLTEEIMSKSPS